MINRKKNISLLTFVLTLILLLSTFWTSTINVAYAEGETVYTNVLDDLKRDERFSVEDFPTVVGDYSLQLVQVAESSDNELFIYVYQPAAPYKELTASEARLSCNYKYVSIDTGFGIKVPLLGGVMDYDLELLSREGPLCKYKVLDFDIKSNETVRSYDIIQFLRPFDSDIDTQLDNDNTITEVSCPISEKVTFTKVGDTTMVDKVDIETIQITDKYVGFVRYDDGNSEFVASSGWLSNDCDSHFVAFSTDKKIENLRSATVSFDTQDWSKTEKYSYGQSVERTVSVSSSESVSHNSVEHFWFSHIKHTYTWNRIQKASEFFIEDGQKLFAQGVLSTYTDVEYTEECKNAVLNSDWVLRFYETDYEVTWSSGIRPIPTFSGTIVSNVSILTLTFEEDGEVYTLGVVDNKQTGSKDPSGTVGTKTEIDFSNLLPDIDLTWLYVVLGVVVLLILVSIIIRITNFFRLKDTSYRPPKTKKQKRK